MESDLKEIIVTSESLLTDIQAAFSAHYPFLLLEFFQRTRTFSTSRQAKMKVLTSVKALTASGLAHAIDVSNTKTVAEVSHEIDAITGVIARISRKSGNVWNTISLTDGWTLERQNAAGEYISELMSTKTPKGGR